MVQRLDKFCGKLLAKNGKYVRLKNLSLQSSDKVYFNKYFGRVIHSFGG